MSYSIGDQIVKSLNLPYEMHLRPGYLWNISKLMLIYVAVTRIAEMPVLIIQHFVMGKLRDTVRTLNMQDL